MRFAWSKCSFIGGTLAFAALLGTAAMGQQKVNATNGINWPPATGFGVPPSSTCIHTGTTKNEGQPYTDLTNNVQYNCGATGWFAGGGGGGNTFTSIILTTGGGETTLTAGGIDTDGGDYEIVTTGANMDIETGNFNVVANGVITFHGLSGCLFAASLDGQLFGNGEPCLTPAGPTGAIQFNAGSGFLNGTSSLTGDTSGNLTGAGDSSFHTANASEAMIVTAHTTTGGYFEAYNDECEAVDDGVPASQLFLTTGDTEASLNVSVANRCSTGTNSNTANAGAIYPTGVNNLWISPEAGGDGTAEGGHIYFAQARAAGELMHYGGHVNTDDPTGVDIFYPVLPAGSFMYISPTRHELVPAPTAALTTTVNGTACAIGSACAVTVPFDKIGSGTNVGHGLVCGAGCVMSASGGGFINANEINGTLMSGLATGLIKNTNGTGVPSIVAAPITITSGPGTYLNGYDSTTGLFNSHAIAGSYWLMVPPHGISLVASGVYYIGPTNFTAIVGSRGSYFSTVEQDATLTSMELVMDTNMAGGLGSPSCTLAIYDLTTATTLTSATVTPGNVNTPANMEITGLSVALTAAHQIQMVLTMPAGSTTRVTTVSLNLHLQ